jgi:murein DD-endopeptidase MepM/ murein hydrolase activator NlpD
VFPGPSPELFQRVGENQSGGGGALRNSTPRHLAFRFKTFGSAPDYIRSTNRLNSVQFGPRENTCRSQRARACFIRFVNGAARSESLQDIAKKYNLSACRLAQANRLPGVALSSSQWLEPGQRHVFAYGSVAFYRLLDAGGLGTGAADDFLGLRVSPPSRLRERRFHQGLDMPRPAGSPVRAAREGTVIFAGWRGAFGRLVIIKHEGGLRTWYGHLSSIQCGTRPARGERGFHRACGKFRVGHRAPSPF